MLIDNLYRTILVEPAHENDELLIVCGYGSAAMIRRHLREPLIARPMIPVRVVLGMARKDGLLQHDHRAIVDLVDTSNRQTGRTSVKERTGRLDCSYITEMPDIHAKVYVWLRQGEPAVAYLGSANYSHAGFSPAQCVEAMESTDPAEAHRFFLDVANRAVPCNDPDIAKAVRIFRPNLDHYPNSPRLVVPLYNPKAGDFAERSGLNWGFGGGRPRSRNEAYIPLYGENVHSDFFPGRLDHDARFTIITDDDYEIEASRGQGSQQGKAISTPTDNTILGVYFRHRMGVPDTRRFTAADCDNYGRHDVTFTKIDDDTFEMDFSVV